MRPELKSRPPSRYSDVQSTELEPTGRRSNVSQPFSAQGAHMVCKLYRFHFILIPVRRVSQIARNELFASLLCSRFLNVTQRSPTPPPPKERLVGGARVAWRHAPITAAKERRRLVVCLTYENTPASRGKYPSGLLAWLQLNPHEGEERIAWLEPVTVWFAAGSEDISYKRVSQPSGESKWLNSIKQKAHWLY